MLRRVIYSYLFRRVAWRVLFAGAVVAVVAGCEAFVDFLALGADGELLRVTAGYPHFAAEGAYGFTGQRRFEDLFLAYVVGEALVVAGLRKLGFLAFEQGGAACGSGAKGVFDAFDRAHVSP